MYQLKKHCRNVQESLQKISDSGRDIGWIQELTPHLSGDYEELRNIFPRLKRYYERIKSLPNKLTRIQLDLTKPSHDALLIQSFLNAYVELEQAFKQSSHKPDDPVPH